ncbi:hypothetical protein [Pseudomonas sp. NPDC089734]|uniref:hypothetical protein n=1 Tax=Pseudomonas sp. NPDC089734 TaxID=3364469 RepID=UPI003807FC12
MDTFYRHILIIALAFTGLGMNPISAIADPTPPATDQNETSPQIVELPDKLNTIIDSLTHDSDVKYYSFTAIRGQRVLINQIDPANAPWLIEYKDGDIWKTKYGDEAYTTPNLDVGKQIQLRVSRKPQHSIPENSRYEILFGSAPRLSDHQVTGDAEQFTPYFGKHRAYRTLDWQTQVVDYKGHPLEGVRVTLELNINQDSNSSYIASQGTSNKSGFIRTSLSLPACHGSKATDPFWIWQHGFRTKWQLTYNPGNWFMYPNSHEKGGVGSKNGEKVSFVHICTQRIIR